MAYLELVTPPVGVRFPLRDGMNTVGRAPGADVLLAMPSLSRRHAEIVVGGRSGTVRDLGSHNGTFLNDERVEGTARIADGDRIRCGDVVMAFRTEPAPDVGFVPRSTADPSADPSRSVSLSHAAPTGGDPLARRLAILLRVGELLARPGREGDLPRRILDLAAEILPLDRAVLLVARQGGELEVVAARGAGSSNRRPFSESIVRYALDHRLAALFTDAQADQRLEGAHSVIVDSIRCSMCAPLLLDDRLLGALYVDNLITAHSFSATDLELLTGFANQAAIALHTASLQDSLKAVAVRQKLLERFFPPATVTKLMESGGDLGVTELSVTALFSDISSFTALSATMAPAEVVGLLHAYFPCMADIVFRREGTLEKYIGDALMAVWGAPFAHEDDADRALAAAVEMQEALVRLNERLPRPLMIHVGLHSGIVALANIGSADYLQVATIGDATNTAARVCSVAGPREIVLTRQTADLLRRPLYPLRALPPAMVKGKTEPLELFKVEWDRG